MGVCVCERTGLSFQRSVIINILKLWPRQRNACVCLALVAGRILNRTSPGHSKKSESLVLAKRRHSLILGKGKLEKGKLENANKFNWRGTEFIYYICTAFIIILSLLFNIEHVYMLIKISAQAPNSRVRKFPCPASASMLTKNLQNVSTCACAVKMNFCG